MTALAGYWALGHDSDPLRACRQMLAAQSVYAPAPEVCARAGNVALGRRLFPLLPEDRFDCGPLQGGGGRWLMVADVRLDDKAALCDQLGIDAETSRALSDAALVMRAVERWGEEAIGRLIGDFALALWDRDQERLLLARDYLGQRPLCFHRGAGFFAFASMAKGLHALADVPYAYDARALKHFLALAPRAPTESFFSGIERVPPGHLCVITRRGVDIRLYWDPPRTVLRLKRPEDYGEAVREQMDRAVAARLRRVGGGVATHLSGGLDSSTVTATAASLLPPGDRLAAFTAVPGPGFDERSSAGRFVDEGPHAASLAARYPNVDHVLIRSGGRSPFASLDRNVFFYERPVLNLCNAVWLDAIHEETKRRGSSVLLTGQMGNFSFSYNGFELLTRLLGRGRLVRLARECLRLRRHGIRLPSAAAHAIGPYLPAGLWAAISRMGGRAPDRSRDSLLELAAAGEIRAESRREGRDLLYRPSRDAFAARLSAIRRFDLGNYNKGTLGIWGIDTRDPTADRRLVELCLTIPVEQYLRGGRTRALARNAFADRLPPEIVNETRKGLQAADWYEGFVGAVAEAREEVERIAGQPQAETILDVERMRRLVGALPQGAWNDRGVDSEYRLALLRGISGGHFLRKVLGAN